MPHHVHPFVNGLVEKITIHGMDGEDPIWQTVRDTVISYPTTLETNTIIAGYMQQGTFVSREIGMHRGDRPLGYHFKKCGNANCEGKNRPGHIMGESRGPHTYRIRCKACKWKSGAVTINNSHQFIRPLHEKKPPCYFTTNFLLPADFPPCSCNNGFIFIFLYILSF